MTVVTPRRFHVRSWAGLVAIAAALSCSASSDERSAVMQLRPVGMPTTPGAVEDDPGAAADAAYAVAVDATLATPPARTVARRGMRCAECGVVESVRSVDRPTPGRGVCAAADSGPASFTRALSTADVAPAPDAVDRALAGLRDAQRPLRAPQYEITIRLRDGSRHVVVESSRQRGGGARRPDRGADRPAGRCAGLPADDAGSRVRGNDG